MVHDKDYILQHVKDVLESALVVFITEPMELQAMIAPLPFNRNQNVRLASLNDDGTWKLTSTGWRMADEALTNMENKAAFWIEQGENLKDFWVGFKKERDMLAIRINALRKEREEADIKESPILFRVLKRLIRKRNTLYKEMYYARFGKSKYSLTEFEMEDLFDKESDRLEFDPFSWLR